MSNETPYGLCKLCEAAAKLGVPPPVSIQNDFSLLDRRFEGHLAEACAPHHLNIGCVLFLGGGAACLGGQCPMAGSPACAPSGSRPCLFVPPLPPPVQFHLCCVLATDLLIAGASQAAAVR